MKMASKGWKYVVDYKFIILLYVYMENGNGNESVKKLLYEISNSIH